MDRKYIEEKTYEKQDYSQHPLAIGDYEGCNFVNCNFSQTQLSGMHFSECVFKACNLSMATLAGTVLQDIMFSDCKMLGLHFETCNQVLFAANYERCALDLCSFYQVKMKKAKFTRCTLKEADFTGADLSEAVFDEADLEGAIFENTTLEKADLRTAFNYAIDPQLNRIKKARFSFPGVLALLARFDIDVE